MVADDDFKDLVPALEWGAALPLTRSSARALSSIAAKSRRAFRLGV
jgi:hypothetical protein